MYRWLLKTQDTKNETEKTVNRQRDSLKNAVIRNLKKQKQHKENKARTTPSVKKTKTIITTIRRHTSNSIPDWVKKNK